MPKKILITGKNWMLAKDFLDKIENNKKYKIFAFDKDEMDISKPEEVEKKIFVIQPEIILNLAAYTNVDDAEDVWEELNFSVNADWVENLAKICWKNWIDFITISTDFVFDWEKKEWYNENDLPNPINQYWFAKFLWEKNAKEFCENSIIIRTSSLYWWWKNFKNFVNSMINLWKKLEKWEIPELKIISDNFSNPTYSWDLADWILKVLENIEKYRWKILHFSNEVFEKDWKNISWFDFAEEIFSQTWKNFWNKLKRISASEYRRKAKTPKFSILKNNSDIKIWDWKIWLKKYLEKIS